MNDTSISFPSAGTESSVADLTVVYNHLREQLGMAPIKRWSKSKNELLDAIVKLDEQRRIAQSPSEPEPVEVVSTEETQGELDGSRLTHDEAIKFIRRHRRRRDIFVRITALAHSGFRDFKSADYLKVSAKQARAAVTLLIGKESTYAGHGIELRVDPPSVPPGSKHKGKLFVG